MLIYHETDYRQLIRQLVEHKKQIDTKFNYQRLAQATGIQKAYLSQVLQGKRDLNRDQLFRVNHYLELSDEEAHYMELLLEYARSAFHERKSKLLKTIQQLQRQYLRTEKNLNVKEVQVSQDTISTYYLDPYHQLLHIALYIPRFRRDPQLLAQAFSLSKSRLRELLHNLEKMNIITIDQGEIKIQTHDIHLPKNSPLFWAWRQSLANLAQHKLRTSQEDGEDAYTFSAVFAADDEARTKIHKLFLDFLKEAKELTTKTKAKQLYQINFDLFSWC